MMNWKDGAQPALFLIFVFFSVYFLCCSMYCLFCVVLCIVCVYMCTDLLPPGGYTIAVKCIISYHISYHYMIQAVTCLQEVERHTRSYRYFIITISCMLFLRENQELELAICKCIGCIKANVPELLFCACISQPVLRHFQ